MSIDDKMGKVRMFHSRCSSLCKCLKTVSTEKMWSTDNAQWSVYA